MKFLLTILIFSFSHLQAQIKYVQGISVTGNKANYLATALPTTTTVQTKLNHQSDSIKTLWRWASDQQKTIKVLRDSIALLSVQDTTKFTGNARVKHIRKYYAEVEIP